MRKRPMETPLLVPNAEPFLLPGGSTGCLLLHGLSASPEEMCWLGEYLAQQGHTVLGLRLAGHATQPQDLARTKWTDWLVSVEEGLALLKGITRQVVLIGQSMGGMVALVSAAHYPVEAVVALSTPYAVASRRPEVGLHLMRVLHPMLRKKSEEHPTLGARREAGYPAYARVPVAVSFEMEKLQAEMDAALPRVQVPVLLMHSQEDEAVPAGDMQRIYDALGTADKQMVLLEGLQHSVVRDPKRQAVFEAIGGFVRKVGEMA
jgi:carboxylesterase